MGLHVIIQCIYCLVTAWNADNLLTEIALLMDGAGVEPRLDAFP
jgi:hypothetical protein